MKLPNIDRVLSMKDAILNDVLFQFCGQDLDSDTFANLVREVNKLVLPKGKFEFFQQNLLDLAGTMLTVESATALAWRLAGNIERIKKKIAVPPWPSFVELEWVLFRVVRVVGKSRTFSSKEAADGSGKVKKHGYEVRLLAISGLPAGRSFDSFWSFEFCDMVKMSFGFSRRNRAGYRRHVSKVQERPFLHANEYYNMFIVGLIDPENVRDGIPTVREFKAVKAALDRNKSLSSLRLRDEVACPFNFDDMHSCYECHVGLDKCPAACHAKTYVQGDCGCGRSNVTFDPESGTCLKCLHR